MTPRPKIQCLTNLRFPDFIILKVSVVPYFVHKENTGDSISSAPSVARLQTGLGPQEASKDSG